MANKSRAQTAEQAGRYEIIEPVGDGPFFQVSKARDRQDERICAVKSVSPAYDGDAAFLHGLSLAASHVAPLAHPNIASLYGTDESADRFSLVTEFVRGINLKERIKRIAPFT